MGVFQIITNQMGASVRGIAFELGHRTVRQCLSEWFGTPAVSYFCSGDCNKIN